eukprot:gene2921-3639_t
MLLSLLHNHSTIFQVIRTFFRIFILFDEQCAIESVSIEFDSSQSQNPEYQKIYSLLNNHLSSHSPKFIESHTHYWSCIDGRTNHHVLGTPGGDAGEFLLGLSVYHSLLNTRTHSIELDEEIIEGLLVKFINQMPHGRYFYMHTDTISLGNMKRYLQNRYGYKEFNNKFNIFDSPQTPFHKQAILDAVIMPDHVGCGHIRAILNNPDLYHIPRALTESFIKTFYQMLWKKSTRMILEVLDGKHEEIGVLEIKTKIHDNNRACLGKIAGIKPLTTLKSGKQSQTFVVHSHTSVEHGIRKDVTNFISSLTSIKRSHIMDQLCKKSDHYAKTTLGFLAPNITMYSAEIHLVDK